MIADGYQGEILWVKFLNIDYHQCTSKRFQKKGKNNEDDNLLTLRT